MRRNMRLPLLLSIVVATVATVGTVAPALADVPGVDGLTVTVDALAPADPARVDPAPAGIVDAGVVLGSGPILIDPGTYVPAPAVQLFATCSVTRRSVVTVWFGYQNVWTDRVDAAVGPTNDVSIDSVSRGNLGQVAQFQPGRVDRAFAVTLNAGQVATWAADVVDLNQPALALAPLTRVVASSSAATPACPIGTPVRSATAQIGGAGAAINITTSLGERRRNGLLVKSNVRFDVSGVTSACSSGGVPLTPKVLFGYLGADSVVDGLILASAGADYAPLPPRQVAGITTLGGATVVWSTANERSIVDPQQLFTYGASLAQSTYWPSARGLSSQRVIADVTARCRFGSQTVSSSTVVWVDAVGRGFSFATVTDAATQTTRAPGFCSITSLSPLSPAFGCDVPWIGIGPGGAKLR
jgi:hypothetical protein